MGAASKTKISVKSEHWTPREVASATITAGGSDYTSPPAVSFADPQEPGGIRAKGRAVLTNGAVTAIEITEAGAGYTAVPDITIEGAAAATAVLAAAGAYQKLSGHSHIREVKVGPFKLNDEWDDRSGVEDGVEQNRANDFESYDDVSFSCVSKSGIPGGPQEFFEEVRRHKGDPFWFKWEYADGSVDEASFGVLSLSNPTDPKKVTMLEVACKAYGSYVKTPA